MEEQYGWDTKDEFSNESTEFPSSRRVKTLYLYALESGGCIIHDGYIQIGIMKHSVEKHMELNPTINWIVTYWCPDVFANRYKRATFQKTEKKNEGSPKTDNQGQGMDLDIKPKGCDILKDK